MQKCISKEQLDCIYLTKESRDEVLKILEPDIGENEYVSIIEDNDREIVVYHFGLYKIHYFYNHWYVRKGYYEFTRYTDKEFKDMFELV